MKSQQFILVLIFILINVTHSLNKRRREFASDRTCEEAKSTVKDYCEVLTDIQDLSDDILKALKPRANDIELDIKSEAKITSGYTKIKTGIRKSITYIRRRFGRKKGKRQRRRNLLLVRGYNLESLSNDLNYVGGQCAETRHADLQSTNEIKFNVRLDSKEEDISFEVQALEIEDKACILEDDSINSKPEKVKERVKGKMRKGERKEKEILRKLGDKECILPHCFLSAKADMLKLHKEEDGTASITAVFDCRRKEEEKVDTSQLKKGYTQQKNVEGGVSRLICNKIQECDSCVYKNKVIIRENSKLLETCTVSIMGSPTSGIVYCVSCGEYDKCDFKDPRRRKLLQGKDHC